MSAGERALIAKRVDTANLSAGLLSSAQVSKRKPRFQAHLFEGAAHCQRPLWKFKQGNKRKIKFYAPSGKKVCVTLKTFNGNEVRFLLGENTALFIIEESSKRVNVFPGTKGGANNFW